MGDPSTKHPTREPFLCFIHPTSHNAHFPPQKSYNTHQTIELCPTVAQSNPYIFEHNATSRHYGLLENNPFLKYILV